MSKTLTAAVQTALDAHRAKERGCIILNFGEGTYKYWTGLGVRTFGGHTWQGAGGLIAVETIAQSLRGDAIRVGVRMNSIPHTELTPAALAEIETTDYKYKTVQIYTAYFNLDTDAFLGLEIEFNGYADTIEHDYVIGGERQIMMSCESKALDLKRTTGQMASDEDQRQIDNLDRGFRHCSEVSEVDLEWGEVERVAEHRQVWYRRQRG